MPLSLRWREIIAYVGIWRAHVDWSAQNPYGHNYVRGRQECMTK